MKALLSRIFAAMVCNGIRSDAANALSCQEKILRHLLRQASQTAFGKDHHFTEISTLEDFQRLVPVRDYEQLKPYFDRVAAGEADVMWKGRPIYLSKTSGTTSGAKYIPITRESVSNHIDSARNALLCYIHETGKSDFVKGKMIFLQGSPKLGETNGIKTGRLSGIVAHHVPSYLLKNRMPSFKTNCIEDWEEKVEAIAGETMKEDMRLLSGIPPWLIMYFEVLKKKTAKATISEIFPKLALIVHGGVNFSPYRQKMEELIGRKVDQIELYPASEGFIAYQDSRTAEGMLLNVNSGIFFEFVRADEMPSGKRLGLKDVKTGVNYAIILSSNAGLWAYNLGDTIRFTSLQPYRITVTGRIKHFTSAFGEHVIAEEVEDAAKHATSRLKLVLHEFHVAPVVTSPDNSLPYHEWLVEAESADLALLPSTLDKYMQERNPYYRDLRQGNILGELRITRIRNNGFNDYMKSIGKLGGQNKLPRLSNDRSVADALKPYSV